MVVQETTADRIATAALHSFTTLGYAGTSMEQIRRDARVSNGSLYHHFGSRAELAARLLVDGMRQSQQAILRVLAETSAAEHGVRGAVITQLGWVQEHAELARLLYGDLPDDVLLAAEPAFTTHNRDYVVEVGAWLHGHTERGTMLDLPFEVAHALWLGPALGFARHWLRGRSRLRPTQAGPELADGAWRALAPR